MHRETIVRQLEDLLGDMLLGREINLAPEATLTGTLMLDALDLIDLRMAIEDGFGITVEPGSVYGQRTLSELVDHIQVLTLQAA